ncbi:MAG TPA: alpha-amylase family glycosyl hydrolase [Anaerolineae bacterium]|nr:alpha-amylase family glycosyl hydrolase [Anaerolineae bacterium]
MEFHVSRRARDRYRFDDSLFSLTGNVVFANLHAARVFAQRMNDQRDLARYPEAAVRAGQINAMGLIDEILHGAAALYRQQVNPAAMRQALAALEGKLGASVVDAALLRFTEEFPPLPVYRRQLTPDDYLFGTTEGVPNREIQLEEMLLLRLANENPAFGPFRELFDDTGLAAESGYRQVVAGLEAFFRGEPGMGPGRQSLIDLLRAPALASPHSLAGQLAFLHAQWGVMLGTNFLRLLSGQDLIHEEEKPVFGGPGPIPVAEFGALASEPVRFSPDLDWMPSLVLLAKNTYVWLHQLSQRYGRPVTRLDQVPDDELDTMARWGFNGLWLIGLWERSPASARIKQLCGNPEAVASAYSLYDYRVAQDLGGEEAFGDLRARAWQRGIRMASDMVPNHVGIFSRWVIEHPDWFVSLDQCPFPSYRFDGPDLSGDGRVGIFVEDHYYDRTDAAVVFKRLDRWTGEARYIYHGNDGTSMPWNDTAQLNYLNPEVREAVIQTILHVARQTPVIRFDAAMTLTKKHYQRLWYPEPGTGGAIPTRAEHGTTKAAFDAAMPAEFWREVVERVAAEAPDTLLLAEAFWLLEGYFVRTLGMHRVYNSAFMHMLRDEDNAKYRMAIKNTLEFDPEILKRYVNFMSNPDEETALAQFGKGDKYFGICTVMATLPGLPMFGHGQVEGLAERYGMEYRRAYRDEAPDLDLVHRHERQVLPLLHHRPLFAGVEHFCLYDFASAGADVCEDVFAYSNRRGSERALVLYHNRFATARGWIRTSAPVAEKTGQGELRALAQKPLGEALGLRPDPNVYWIFQDAVSRLEYIRSGRDLCEQGLYAELDAYRCHVFLNWRDVQDDAQGCYARLASALGGRGVPSIETALREVELQPVHVPYRELVNADTLRNLIGAASAPSPPRTTAGGGLATLLDQLEGKARHLAEAAKRFSGGEGDEASIAAGVRRDLEVALWLLSGTSVSAGAPSPACRAVAGALQGEQLPSLDHDPAAWGTLLGWAGARTLGRVFSDAEVPARSRSWLDEWMLNQLLAGALSDLGLDEGQARQTTGLVGILVAHQAWAGRPAGPGRAQALPPAYQVLDAWMQDGDVLGYLRANRFEGVLWFHRESFDRLLEWMLAVAAVQACVAPAENAREAGRQAAASAGVIQRLREAEEQSGYRVEALLSAARR